MGSHDTPSDLDETRPSVQATWTTPIPDSLIFCPEATPQAVRVYAALKSFKRGSFPSLAWLGDRLGADIATIRRAIQLLDRLGYVTVEARFRADGGQTSNLYHLHDAPLDTTRTPPRRRASRRGIHATPPLSPARPQDFDLQEDLIQENQSQNTSRDLALRSLPTRPDAFDDFWAAYPRKVGKPAARQAFTRALRTGGTLDAMAAGLNAWTAYWTERDEPEYVPHPSTWLNQRRWEDRPPAPRRAPGNAGLELVLARRAAANGGLA
jgi:hypothetical protein